jgi:hypothetical protein
MKALSVRQPWTSLIADGKKTIEIRSRRTHYRGPILICSSRHPSGDGPKGVAMIVVDLVDCRLARPSDKRRAHISPPPGSWAWIIRPLFRVDPFPVRGQLGLFDVPVPPYIETMLSAIPPTS